ncbi:ABC transporter substrate-binding protein [Cryptosporangium sp. NPDC051539]|uniref:ABC transporter substrate-binding protein n=1 Tax=Cryptosporangium sp. NPDC051539 TaxID=3363962 RepID=UPI0037AC089B
MRLTTAAAYGLCLTLALAGCSGGSGTGGTGTAPVIEGGTFTLGLAQDPGALDPQGGAGTSLFTVSQFAYDSLVSVDGKTGEVQSALAKSWDAKGTAVTLTLNEGITCSDGAALTASDVAANINYVANPKNSSPFLGVFLPAGSKATGDDASRVVTLTLAQPSPFVLNGLASLPIVCAGGMKNRAALSKTTSGTGPFTLVEVAPGDHYTYQLRDGYTWGPNGATTATKGMPKTVVVKIVQNETTAANLLLSGGLSASQILGPDAARLEKAGLFSATTPALVGEQWYNHAKGRVTEDPKVRLALTQALDLPQLQKVLTSGKGTAATTLADNVPIACPGDSIKSSLPASDPKAAGALLDQAGWTRGADGRRTKAGKPLTLTMLYQTTGSGSDAAAELTVKQWKAVGVTATAKAQNETTLTGTLFGAGDWDVAWVPLHVNTPDQLVPFLSGAAAPKGTNFAAISDPVYDQAVKAAMAIPGTDGCKAWLDAESGLIARASIVPFASTNFRTFGKAAKFETPGGLVPTSIRMLAK